MTREGTVYIAVRVYGQWLECNGAQGEYYGLTWAKHNNYIVP